MTKELYIECLEDSETEQELRNVLSLACADNEIEVEDFKELCSKYISIDLSK